jgi:hypothetical protein
LDGFKLYNIVKFDEIDLISLSHRKMLFEK